jgi:predicted metal-dependent phosphoesterase TrpH
MEVRMKLDLHVHTTAYSACSVMSPDEAMAAAKKAGLDGICITEHNKIWKAEDAAALSARHGLPVFRGLEITTTGGDILVFGIEEEPAQLWTPARLKQKVDREGGVAIAAHPFRGFLVFGFSVLQMEFEDALENPIFGHVHGVEVCNSLVTNEENDLARRVAEELGLVMVGGSDAHTPTAVGSCITHFEDWIETERDLAAAVLAGRCRGERVR